jgi:hypothetical protein
MFGSRRDEVTGGWRRLHNEELHGLYSSSDIRIIKSVRRWVGHVACIGEMRNANFWFESLRGRDLGRPRRRWKKIGMEGVDWIHLAQDRDQWLAVVNVVMKNNKCGES